MINAGIIKHHIPSLRQKSKKFIYVADYCCFCDYLSKHCIFRLNTKLKVFKCFNCGTSGKTTASFIYHNRNKTYGSSIQKATSNEVYYGCLREIDYTLPF
jgi:hypothetical protein